MFVSTGNDVKFHSITNQDITLSYKPNHNGNIKSVSWAKDNGFLAFVTKKGFPEIISIRDPNNIKNVHTITSIDNASVIAFQRTTKRFLGIGADLGQVAIYDTRSKSISKLLQSSNSGVCCLDFNCTDKYMAICSKLGRFNMYDVLRGISTNSFEVSNDCTPTTMRFHPSLDHLLAIALEDGTITQWDLHLGKRKYSAKIHLAAVTGLVLIENSNLLLSVGVDNKFSIQDINMRESTFSCNQPYPLTAMDASFDGISIAIGSEYGDVYTYDIRQLIKPLEKIKPHSSQVTKILFENKIKDEIGDDSSDFLSVSTTGSNEDVVTARHPTQKMTSQHFFSRTLQHTDEKLSSVEKKPSITKNLSKEVAESKIVQTQEIFNKVVDDVKKEMHQHFQKGKTKLEQHLSKHVENLEKFMYGEFQTIFEVLDEKFQYFQLMAESKVSQQASKRSVN